jgi:hypothetical protein
VSARTRLFYPHVTSKRTLQCIQVTDAPAAIIRSSVRPSVRKRPRDNPGVVCFHLISLCYSIVNGYEPSSPSLISSTGSTEEPADHAVEYCQCPESDGEAFIECQVCGSFYEPGTYYPLFSDLPIVGEYGSFSIISLPCLESWCCSQSFILI